MNINRDTNEQNQEGPPITRQDQTRQVTMHILQLNYGKKTHRVIDALTECSHQGLDVEAMMLQELGDCTMLALNGWVTYHSKQHQREPGAFQKFPRITSGISIKKALALGAQQVPIESLNMVAVHVRDSRTTPEQRKLLISAYLCGRSNAPEYNNCLENLEKLAAEVREAMQTAPPFDQCIFGGDLNLSHGPWSNASVRLAGRGTRFDAALRALGLELATPRGLTTSQKLGYLGTTIDITYALGAQMNVRSIQISSQYDHIPLVMNADSPRGQPSVHPMSCQRIEWERFPHLLQKALHKRPEAKGSATQEWEQILASLEQALCSARKPVRKGTHPMLAGWNEECQKVAKARRRVLQRELTRIRSAQGQLSAQEQLIAAYKDERYRRLTKILKARIQDAKRTHLMDRLGTLTDRTHWQAVSILQGKHQQAQILSPPFFTEAGDRISYAPAKLEMLRKHLFPCSQRLNEDTGAGTTENKDGILEPCTHYEIDDAIEHLDPTKAPGPDGVRPLVLKHAYKECALFRHRFRRLVQMSIETAQIPQQWRQAKITVIPKTGNRDKSSPKAYRPITVLNVGMRLVDGVVAQRLHALHHHGLLTPHHYGGMKDTSTTHVLCTLLERGRNALHCCLHSQLVTIDVSGAFNNIDHHRLVTELQQSAGPALSKWIQAWLKERAFEIHFEGNRSNTYKLGSRGIPQGSPLSPLIWSIYLDSFFRFRPQKDPILVEGAYVDDLFLLVAGKTAKEAQHAMQDWMDDLGRWSKERGLELDKPTLMQLRKPSKIGKRRTEKLARAAHVPMESDEEPQPDPQASQESRLVLPSGDPISAASSTRILGIELTCDLSLWTQIAKIESKTIRLAKALQGALRNAGESTLEVRKKIAQIGLVPILDYACPIYTQLRTVDEQRLRAADRAITYFILGIPIQAKKAPSALALTHELGMLTTKQRWEVQRRTFAAKLLAGKTKTSELARSVLKAQIDLDNGTVTRTRFYRQPLLIQNVDAHCKFKSATLEKTHSSAHALAGPLRTMTYSCPTPVETLQEPDQLPWMWKPLQIHIQDDIEKARKTVEFETRSKNRIHIFTDGSVQEEEGGGPARVGAAAVLYQGRRSWNVISQLNGATNDIFRAELTAILLGLATIKEHKTKQINVFSDSKSALQRLKHSWRNDHHSGQNITSAIRKEVQRLTEKGVHVDFWWVPAHIGIRGNEAADAMAKRAAKDPPLLSPCKTPLSRTEQVQPPRDTETYPVGLLKNAMRKEKEKERQKTWKPTDRYDRHAPSKGHFLISPTFSPTNHQTYEGFPGYATAELARWRTNALYKYHSTAEKCLCDDQYPRNREHLLLRCHLLQKHRQTILNLIPPTDHNLPGILQAGKIKGLTTTQKQTYLAALAKLCTKAARLSYRRWDESDQDESDHQDQSEETNENPSGSTQNTAINTQQLRDTSRTSQPHPPTFQPVHHTLPKPDQVAFESTYLDHQHTSKRAASPTQVLLTTHKRPYICAPTETHMVDQTNVPYSSIEYYILHDYP